MSNPRVLGFQRGDLSRLRTAARQAPDSRPYERILAVQMVASGDGIGETAHRLHRHYLSVHRWVHRFLRRHCIEDLNDGARCGRPGCASGVTRARVLAELRHKPFRVGFPASVWTIDRLACRLRERYGLAITGRTLRRRFHQWGLRWKRLRLRYVHAEAHLAQKRGPLCGNCGGGLPGPWSSRKTKP